MENENNGKIEAGRTNAGGPSDIARSVQPPAAGEKRGRGRPPGPAAPRPTAPNVEPIPPVLWNTGNVGALVRLPFAGVAFATDIKEIALTPAEQEMIVPAAVEVFNQFAPLAAAKWAGVIALSAALITVGASKVKIYRDETAKRDADAKKKKAD